MRDYKFRGKCLNDCKWYEGYLVIFPNGLNCICYTNGDEFKQVTNIIPETVGQYTGLKDKNGVEIYDGDVVKAESWEPKVFEIQFLEGGFCATYGKIDRCPTDINLFYSSVGCGIEVIGNIYNNPELLEGNTNDR